MCNGDLPWKLEVLLQVGWGGLQGDKWGGVACRLPLSALCSPCAACARPGPALPSGFSKLPLSDKQVGLVDAQTEVKTLKPPPLASEMLTYPWPGSERRSLCPPSSRRRARPGHSGGPRHQPRVPSFTSKRELAHSGLRGIQRTSDVRQMLSGQEPPPQSWTGPPGRQLHAGGCPRPPLLLGIVTLCFD